LLGLVCVNNARGCWIVAQRAWVPIYKIGLTHREEKYKNKVKEKATFLVEIKRDDERAAFLPWPCSNEAPKILRPGMLFLGQAERQHQVGMCLTNW
jgi:hypothetical protein